MKLCSALILCATAATLAGCKSAPANCNAPDTSSAVQALKDNETQWNADFASKDAAKIVAHYADDATLAVSGEKPTVGKDAIQAEFKGMTSDPAFSLVLSTDKVVVAASGDIAYTTGSYKLSITNPMDKKPVNDSGVYVTTYRKGSDGAWKAVWDAPTSVVPPPMPEPQK